MVFLAAPSVPLPKTLQTARFLVRPISFLERWRKELGETFHASLFGPGEVVLVSDAPSMKALYGADRINTIAPGRNVALRPMVGASSLLLQEDQEHLRRRKLMLPPFHGERMRAYEEMIVEATEDVVASWPAGEAFAVHPGMQAITLEVILRAVFGVTDQERRSKLSSALVEALAVSASPRAIGFIVPGLSKVPPFRNLEALRDHIDVLLFAEIAERRVDPDLEERKDILSMLVSARFEDGSQMEDRELRDQLMTLLLAGHETTATALAWAIDLLLHHPAKLERLTDEVNTSDGSGYMDAVIDETLRVRPVVPFTGRQLRQDSELRRVRPAERHRRPRRRST